MNEHERRLEQLIGRRVYGSDGRVVGRLEECLAEREGDYYVITEFHIGRAALLERLAVRYIGLTLGGRWHGYRARWDQLDIEDAVRLTLTCRVEELRRMATPRRQHS